MKTITAPFFLFSTCANLVIDSVSLSVLSVNLLLAYHPVKSESRSSNSSSLYQANAATA